MKRPLKIGLAGGIGSGKSTVAELFRLHGVPVLDADMLTRELTRPGQPALEDIRALFGDDILDEEGRLRRDRLRERVFADDYLRRQLENLLHPRVYEQLETRSQNLTAPYVLWVVPLLLETAAGERVDRILVVDCPERSQIERVMARDRQRATDVEMIMKRQLPRQKRLRLADDVLINDHDIDHLRGEVARLHSRYLELAGTRPTDFNVNSGDSGGLLEKGYNHRE